MNLTAGKKLSSNLNDNKEIFYEELPIGTSFDVIGRDLTFGKREGIIIDSRTYPARNPEEPDLEKVSMS